MRGSSIPAGRGSTGSSRAPSRSTGSASPMSPRDRDVDEADDRGERRPTSGGTRQAQPAATSSTPTTAHAATGHGYETEYLLASDDDGIDIAALRAAIQSPGIPSSWPVTSASSGSTSTASAPTWPSRQAWPGAASAVSVRDLDEQVAPPACPAPPRASAPARPSSVGRHRPGTAPGRRARHRHRGRAPMAWRASSQSLGARVVRPAHGTRPSVGEIAEAILARRLERGHRAARTTATPSWRRGMPPS